MVQLNGLGVLEIVRHPELEMRRVVQTVKIAELERVGLVQVSFRSARRKRGRTLRSYSSCSPVHHTP